MKKQIYFIFLSSLAVFLLSLVVISINNEKKIYYEFLELLKSDDGKIDSYLLYLSNKDFSKYLFLKGIKHFWNNEPKEGYSSLVKALSNGRLRDKEIGISKFLIGQYLLFEENNPEGISFLTSEESYKFFHYYVNYALGIYNFNKENYDEAIEFFNLATNIPNEEIKKDIFLRIYFIETAKYKDVNENTKKTLSSVDKTLIKNLIKN
ncbi:MAG: hypothetical protein ACK4F9_02495 [Brevinematia bacterium]